MHLGVRTSPGERVDVAELAVRRRCRRLVADCRRHGRSPSQEQRPLLVVAAHRVDQSAAKRPQAGAQQLLVTCFLGDARGLTEALDPGTDGGSGEGGLPCLQEREGAAACGYARWGRGEIGPRGAAQRRCRRRPQLHRKPGLDVVQGSRSRNMAARLAQARDQQDLRPLVERLAPGDHLGQGQGPVEVTDGCRRHHLAAQQRVDLARHPLTLHEQPEIELDARTRVHPLQQLAGLGRVEPTVGKVEQVHGHALRQVELDRVAGQAVRRLQGPSYGGQAPAHRAERIRGFWKQLGCELSPGQGPIGEQYPGQQGPDLEATDRTHLVAVRDVGPPDEMYPHGCSLTLHGHARTVAGHRVTKRVNGLWRRPTSGHAHASQSPPIDRIPRSPLRGNMSCPPS